MNDTSGSPACGWQPLVGLRVLDFSLLLPGPFATVTLADQNAITASILAIGDVGANNHGGTSTLRLGRINTLNVGAINCGASGRSNSNLLFDPGTGLDERVLSEQFRY